MRSFVHFDADYSLSDWKTAMQAKPLNMWRAIIAQLPQSYVTEDAKRQLAHRLLVDGFATQADGLLYCLSSGAVVLLFEGRASGWVETFGRLLGALDERLIKTMQLYDLGVEKNEFYVQTHALLPAAASEKRVARSPTAPELNAEKLQEIQRLRTHRLKPQVLVVEDDPFTRGLITTLIQNKCDVISAGSLRQALSLYKQKLPDLVFLDIELPDGKGTDALKAITQADSNAFVVMLSSHTAKENIVACLDRGAKGFIAKPFTRERIMHHIELAHERRRADAALHSAG